MRCPSPGRRRAWLALLLAPPLAWLLIVAAMPTAWARSRLEARLARETGLAVAIGELRLGPCGGLTLFDVRAGSNKAGAAPWLRLDRVGVNHGLFSLAFGCAEPIVVEVDGVEARIVRDADGRFEGFDPMAPRPAAQAGAGSARPRANPVEVHVRSGRVRFRDDRGGTRFEVAEVRGRGGWRDGRASVEELAGRLNGGTLTVTASLDRVGGDPVFAGQVRAEGVSLDDGFRGLGLVAPVLAARPEALGGRMDLSFYVETRGRTVERRRAATAGYGSVRLDPIRLDGCELTADLAAALGRAEGARIGSARSDFTIGGGRVQTDNLVLDLGGLDVALAGWTDFDGRIEYRIKPEASLSRLPREARELLDELPGGPGGLADVRLVGTLERPSVVGLPGGEATRAEDREKLRKLGRKVRDRILR